MARLILIVLVLLAGQCARANDTGRALLVPGDLEAFADGVITTVMQKEHVAGAVVGVMAEGEVILLKGYGFRDVDQQLPVDPMTTLFRPGSVTKLFTWVALMQLRDQGKVDFDTDINEYLTDVAVPATFAQPITIKHLMTHTPGFEDHVLGLFSREASSLRPLRELLQEEMPARVRPPGQLASYSNHGVALAGLIVEEVSGEPWASYVERHILEPLGMDHTTMRQPLPENIATDMSKGYEWVAGRYVEQDFEFVPAAPAGSASASGADMMALLSAFLNNGGAILSPASNAEMQSVLFRAVPDTTGIMHGFYETSSHGQLLLGHGGDTLWFHSELKLMPEVGVGWFISTNSAAGGYLRGAFERGFLDRYFGKAPAPEHSFERTDPAVLVGYYGSLRHSHHDFTKLIKLLGAMQVSVSPTGELMLAGGGQVNYLTEIAPLTFAVSDSDSRITFETNEKGIASHLYFSSSPVVAFERLEGVDSPALHQLLINLSLLVLLWVSIGWTIQRFNRRYVLPASVARFRLLAWWMALSVLVFFAVGLSVTAGANDIVFGISAPLQAALLIPYITSALAFACVVFAPSVLRDVAVTRTAKLGYLVVVMAGIAVVWLMTYWQIL
ncbi:MAG: serine hydrolase domain-containing protein [Pseudomonadota bacterium]